MGERFKLLGEEDRSMRCGKIESMRQRRSIMRREKSWGAGMRWGRAGV